MPRRTRSELINRLEWIYQVEGMNAVMFFGVMLFLIASYGFTNLIFMSYGILFCCFILLQGTYYWWIKYSSIKEEKEPVEVQVERLKTFKHLNHIGLILIPMVFLLQWFISGYSFSSDNLLGWAIFANLFAVLEYINYYHKQLMYDNRYDLRFLYQNRILKEATLHKDLREN